MFAFPDGRRIRLAGAGALTVCLSTALLPASAQSTIPPPRIIGPESVRPGDPRVIDLSTQTVDLDGVAIVDESAERVAATLNANVAFDKDRAELKPEATARLDGLVAELRGTTPGPVDITGHTDDLGTHEHGVDLSERRARAVRHYLEPRLPGFHFTSRGLAEAHPVAPNNTEENRARNRRVEIVHQRPAESPAPAPARTPDGPASPPTPVVLTSAGTHGDQYTITVGQPERVGALARLAVTITQTRPPDSGRFPTLPFLARDGAHSIPDRSGGMPTGVVLIDRATALEHRPAAGDWHPAAPPSSRRENQCFARPQQALERTGAARVSFTCWYASPASDAVDIKVGEAGTIAGVPVR